MKKIILWVGLFCIAFPLSVTAEPKVKSKKDGIYHQSIWNGWYQVDSVAQICLYGQEDYSSITEVDCMKLANRPEWQKVITWKETAPIPAMVTPPEMAEEIEADSEEKPAPKGKKMKKK